MGLGTQSLALNAAVAANAAAVVPADGSDLPNAATKGLYIGVAGDVKVTMMNGGDVVFKAAPVGLLRIQAKRVWATGTAATNIVALW